MKINTDVLRQDSSGRSASRSARKPQHGYESVGFTPEQVNRVKKHQGTAAQRDFVRKSLKLKMNGYDNEMLVGVLEHMPTRQIGDLKTWGDVLGLLRAGVDPEKAYWAHQAGFSSTEVDAVKGLSVESLKMMVKVQDL